MSRSFVAARMDGINKGCCWNNRISRTEIYGNQYPTAQPKTRQRLELGRHTLVATAAERAKREQLDIEYRVGDAESTFW